jgi:hypothetical protein
LPRPAPASPFRTPRAHVARHHVVGAHDPAPARSARPGPAADPGGGTPRRPRAPPGSGSRRERARRAGARRGAERRAFLADLGVALSGADGEAAMVAAAARALARAARRARVGVSDFDPAAPR